MKQKLFKIFSITSMFFWAAISAYAQQNAVKGLVMEKSGVSRIANVSVVNTKTGARVLSNELGLFQIAASAGDTLLLSKCRYRETLTRNDRSCFADAKDN